MDYSWANKYPEIQRICKFFDLKELENPIRFTYTPLISYIQDGPQCGIVALAMALNNSTKEFVDKLLQCAIDNGYTYNGEMFSAVNMMNLAKKFHTNTVELYSGNLSSNIIIDYLFNKKIILVPFDSGKDNGPSLENGQKAHWSVIHGIIQCDDYYIFARHGKIHNVAIWKLSDLAKSNSQLNEFNMINYNYNGTIKSIDYYIPDGGIAGEFGLREKAVILTIE